MTNVKQLINNQTLTANGSVIYRAGSNQESTLFYNITGAVSGNITFTLQQVDPNDESTAIGSPTSTGAISSPGIGQIVLYLMTSPTVKLSWTVAGGSPSFAGVYASMASKSVGNKVAIIGTSGGVATVIEGSGTAGTASANVVTIQGIAGGTVVPVSGTVTATNPSVSATAAAPPASATYTGGSVTTAAPTYTTGQINALSLTTAGALRTDASGTTQPVSGTITANIGTSGSLALDATLTNRTQFTKLTDGANNATVKAASTAAIASDTAIVVAISPNNSITASNPSVTTTGSSPPASATYIGGSVTTAAPTYTTGQMSGLSLTTTGSLRVDNSGVTQPISGTIAATQSGTWTVQPGNTANTTPWLSTISQGGNSATVSAGGALKVDNSAVTQPVSGTITANIGTSGSLALDATVAKLTVAQSAALGSNTQALIGASVTTAAPTYTTGNINPLSLTTAGALRTDASGTTQPVSGTITANIGTSGSLALDATLTNRSQFTKLTDGTNNATVKAASTAAIATDTAIVVAISPNNSITASNPSVTTTGSAPPASATYIGGSVTTAAPSYTTGQMSGLSLTTSGALRTDASGTTQPVSGTITANAGSGNFTVIQSTASSLNAAVVGVSSDNAANSTTKLAVIAGRANAAAPTWTEGNMVPLSVDNSGSLRITGSISASNPSVSTTGSTPPASSTYIGGSVTTAAPTYTTGQMSGLSLTTTGSLRVDNSGVTQPVSQATAANLNATVVGSGVAGTPNSGVVTVQGITNGVGIKSLFMGQSGFYPSTINNISTTDTPALTDKVGNLIIRGSVLTDETSFRDDFSGSALTTAITGTLTFTNNSLIVTGSGSIFSTQVEVGSYIKKTADADSLYVLVDSVDSDTQITLASIYTGTTASTTGVNNNWLPVTGTGGSITVATSSASLATGTTSGSVTSLFRNGDYGPFIFKKSLTLSQRIVNQEFRIGLQDVATITPSKSAVFRFTGTTNTSVDCITNFSSAAADTQSTTVSLPSGNTSTAHEYKIDVSFNFIVFSIDGFVVAKHSTHIPGPYDIMGLVCVVQNTAVPASTTTLAIDYTYFNNVNRVEINDSFSDTFLTTAVGNAASGSAVNGNPVLIAGSDGTNARSILTDASGRQIISTVDGQRTTYSASIIGLVAVATPTDIFTLTGSASKTIRVNRLIFSGTQTTGAVRDIVLLKRSTADTAGTSTAPTKIPYDSTNAAATATVLAYTANPTLGTLVGNISTRKALIPATTAVPSDIVYDFGTRNNQAVVLRGTAEVFAVNMNSVTSTGNSYDITVEWTEE